MLLLSHGLDLVDLGSLEEPAHQALLQRPPFVHRNRERRPTTRLEDVVINLAVLMRSAGRRCALDAQFPGAARASSTRRRAGARVYRRRAFTSSTKSGTSFARPASNSSRVRAGFLRAAACAVSRSTITSGARSKRLQRNSPAD